MAVLRPLVLVLCLLSSVSKARAYEDEVGLAVNAGYSLARLHGRTLNGSAAGVTLDYGLAEYFTLRGHLDYAFHPGPGNDPNVHTASLATEVIYLVDVLTVVPFLGAGLDIRAWREPGTLDLLPAAHVVIGADYLASREWTFGIDVRALVTPDPSGKRPVQLLAMLVARYLLDD